MSCSPDDAAEIGTSSAVVVAYIYCCVVYNYTVLQQIESMEVPTSRDGALGVQTEYRVVK